MLAEFFLTNGVVMINDDNLLLNICVQHHMFSILYVAWIWFSSSGLNPFLSLL